MTPSSGIHGSEFGAVDSGRDPYSLVKFLDNVRAGRHDDGTSDSPALTALDARPGEAILDVGCGRPRPMA
jgi:hypothetical protein